MSERNTLTIIWLMGLVALALAGSIAWASATGKPIDALAGTVLGGIVGGFLGLLKSDSKTPAAQVPPPKPEGEIP